MFAGEVDLNTWYKPTIDRKILKDLSKRSNLKGIIDISIFGLSVFMAERADMDQVHALVRDIFLVGE